MIARSLLLATALLAASASIAAAQSRLEQADIIRRPALRANVQVSSDHRADRRPHRQCRLAAQIAI